MLQCHRNRAGFVLVEALVALLVLAVAFLAFEGSLSIIIRSVAESEREAVAAGLADTRRERVFSVMCASGSGVDSASGVVLTWSASSGSSLTHLIQATSYESRFGVRVETYNATGRCY